MAKRGQAVPKTTHFLNLPLTTYQRLQWLWRSKEVKFSRAGVEALTVWAEDVERGAWDGLGMSKQAGAPYPPRPPGANNRRGGARQASTIQTVQTSLALPATLEERLLAACFWRGLSYNPEAVRYLDRYLDAQGAPVDVARELEAMDAEAVRPHGQLATEDEARVFAGDGEL